MKSHLYLIIFMLFSSLAFGQSPFVKSAQAPQAEVSFYPNPAKDVITFKYNSGKTAEIYVYNVLGSRVKTFSHTGTETVINITDLQKGLYFIRFTEGNSVISKSFTKTE